MIRLFDVTLCLLALVLVLPLALLIAILIKIDSPGPVLFGQERVGRDGRPFRMLKFRKMRSDLRAPGPSITSRYDSRLTVVGRWLERTKLDELPQLINVLKGDMSIVGPRPELKKFTEAQQEKWEKVLSVKPGLIGMSQILNRNESEMYPADCRDREEYYVKAILPGKLDLDVYYVENMSLLLNLKLLGRAFLRTLFGVVTRDSFISAWRSVYLVGAYTLISVLSMYLAYHLRFQGGMPSTDMRAYRFSLPAVLAISPFVFLAFRAHRRMFGSITLEDFASLFKSSVMISFLAILALVAFDIRGISRLVYCVDFFGRFLGLVFLAYVEFQVGQKHKLLTSRAIRTEAVFESLVVGFLSLLSTLIACRVIFPPEAFSREIRQSQWIMFSLLFLNPLIYLITFQEVPARFLYFVKVKCHQVAMIVAQGALFLLVISLLFDVRAYSRAAIALSLCLSAGAMLSFFTLMWALRWRSMPTVPGERVLLIGLTPDSDLFISALKRSHRNYSIVGIISGEIHDRFYTVSRIEVLGGLNDLNDVLSVYHVDAFVVSRENLGERDLRWVRRTAREHDIRIRYVSGVDRFMREGDETKPSAGF
jgi:lipopolysaccharide/colanic/teichoic acid biosynthesis glycosyltransferase